MSQATYCKMWADAQKDLDVLLQKEREEFLQPETNLEKVSKMLATSYIQYLEVFRKLAAAYDHLLHRQKRAAIRPVLDSVMGRILEIKREMVKVENSECQCLDDILMELNRPLEDIEIPIPKYFIEENLEVLREREKTLDEILLNAGLQEQEPVEAMALPEAIKLIQVAERARQGRSRAVFMRRIYLEENRTTKQEEQTGPSPDDAATRIQKVWRGYAQRKRTEKMREEEMIFLGIILPPHLEGTGSFRKRAGTAKALQGDVQERQDEVSFKEKLRESEGAHIKETLQDQISQCFTECRHITGRFPDYPPEKAGGSKAIFSEKTPEQVLEELIAKQEAEKADQKGKDEKEQKEKPKEKKPQKAGKKEEDEGWKMGPSNFLSILEEGSSQFKVFWQNRDNESDFLQDHDPELIKEGEREEVEEEIRVQVCELMEEKLRNLKLHVDGEKVGTQKKGGKAEKAGKASAKKKIPEMERDLTPDRTIDSLYQELAEGGLLIKARAVNLSDYIGNYDCLRSSLRGTGAQPLPSAPDVRQLVALYGILPLGSQMVHENAPLVKSLLLAGPAGVGKKMLVHAICTETGANLFNLTPSNIAGKYPGKEGLLMMLHMVLKVGKELQPSVVWIGDTEKMFSKAAPKGEEEMNSKRLGKMLPQFLKALKPKDRVLLVGTTARPFEANMGPFCKVYQKIILISRPDYTSRFALWKHFILQNGGAFSSLENLSCLAQLSDGFTQGHILDVVQTVLSELRLLQMPRKPLKTVEFATSLARHIPVYKEEQETFEAWYAKTPLGRAWSTALAEREAEEGKAKKGKK
ncbi:dynein regulatory complex protein 11 isoform X1 [Empidonax traillii]|uniref:dynein regulatory complex protein 11 isoform X1 n=1 Tax=Empidonax traillii TaxID=164674 RepID=UPI000FFD5177|nr:dynein regulatory complex protein 11 isoform X1 [Empidonax traillii]